MLDFLYNNAWGAFLVLLLLELPFIIIFLYIVNKKAFSDSEPADTAANKYPSAEYGWLAVAIGAFIVINIVSIKYMPTVVEANTPVASADVKDVHVTARSWSYEISDTEYKAGQTVRFLVKSVDTVHSFAVYHPDGQVLFTMMLVPGLETESAVVHTFADPGEYTVRCLEYCGIAHHAMKNTLTVL